MGIDLTTLAAGKSYTDKVAEEIITSDQKENIQKLTSGGEGNKALFDDGTYKTVSGSASDYESLYNRPVINGVELVGNRTPEQLGFSDAATSGSYNDLKDKPEIPTLISQLVNDSYFITISVSNLMNYYSKMESYSKTEINSLIANLNSLTIEIIEVLPSENISATTMYLQKETDKNSYLQWLYLNNEWANIGTTDIDLTNYYSKADTDDLLNKKVNIINGFGLSQANFTSEEKLKLASLSNTGNIIDNNTTSTTKTWSSTKISDEVATVSKNVNDINLSQKTVNTQLEYCFGSLAANPSNQESITVTTNTNDTIKFIPYVNNNIEFDVSTWSYTLKANKTYSIEALARIATPNSKYFYLNIYDKTNARWIGTDGLSATTSPLSQSVFQSKCVIKPTTNIEICVKVRTTGDETPVSVNASYFIIQEIGRNVTIDPVEHINTANGIEDTPVGSILPQMGKTAPKHYLICDGAIYKIVEYPYLSQYIKDQFGTFNFFGGDGSSTFAVPDLRDEFLRGYHENNSKQLSGEIGVHQEATQIPSGYFSATNSRLYVANNTVTPYVSKNYDSISQYQNGTTVVFAPSTSETNRYPENIGFVAPRPTNVSVLYCIKYEPTYFININGLVDEIVLWEGNVGTTKATTVANSINLKDSFTNYDKIGFFFTCIRTDGSLRPQYKEIYPSQIIACIQSNTNINHTISLVWGFSNVVDYTDIQRTSTNLRLDLNQYQSRLDKVIGIRYRSTSGTGGGDDTTYTDSEIRDYVEGILNGNQ
ncbi:phage tail protein [Lacrimispora sp.]|uniref:phage tail protein n=1 Tax=Lacrimispora sp. TaxID=2719234 RepID=UPI0028AEC676|nr:phage tail protein [Lacrimispora sp.]